MGHKHSKASATPAKQQSLHNKSSSSNPNNLNNNSKSSQPPLQNSPSSSAANSHEFLPPSLFASYLNTHSSSSSIVQQFHTKLSEDQCQLMIKGVIQSYFGIPTIFPVFSEEWFESIWALQNILASDSARNVMLAYSEELYWINYCTNNDINGCNDNNNNNNGLTITTPLSSVSTRLAKAHDIFSPIFYTRHQLLKNLSASRGHHDDHDGGPLTTWSLQNNNLTTTNNSTNSSNETSNMPSSTRLKYLTIEWSIKLLNQEAIVVATHRLPLWIANLRLRYLLKQCKQTTSMDSTGNCKILFPVIEISNQLEAKMLLSVHEMIPLIFELMVMYLSCPMLLLKWVDETEPHHIRELFDDHNISTIQLFTCCEMISQKVFSFLADLSSNPSQQNIENNVTTPFGKDLIEYFSLLKQLGQHGIGLEWKNAYRSMFSNWQKDISFILDSDFNKNELNKNGLSMEHDFVELCTHGGSAVAFLPKNFMQLISSVARKKIEKDNKISIHEIKNTKAMTNIASFWLTMELLDDKYLNEILTFSKRTQELILFKQAVSLLSRKVTEENTYSFFKIAQELKIDTLTELCNLYTQYSKFKSEISQTKTTRRRSLAMVMLKKTPSEVSLTNSPFQFTKRSYYDTSEMEFALSQISTGKSMQIRVWICGGRKPGKTSLVCRYMFGKFDVTYDTSINESYRKLEGNFVIDLMDSSGQSPASEVNNIELIRSCDIFVVCYSVKDKNSFLMVEEYIQNFKILKDNIDPIIIIVALQCDSPRSMWQTTTDAGIQLAQQHSALFFEVSSYLGVNVRDVFVSGILEHCRQCSLR